jgi:hypothetical protein
MLEARSWARAAGKGLTELGEPEAGDCSESSIEPPPNDIVLSDGACGLVALLMADDGLGGARPFPLPRMRPPPSLRLVMTGELCASEEQQVGKPWEMHGDGGRGAS